MNQSNINQAFENVIRDFSPFWNSTSRLMQAVTGEIVKMTGLSTQEDRNAAFNFMAAAIVSVPGLLLNLTNNTGTYDWDIGQFGNGCNCTV